MKITLEIIEIFIENLSNGYSAEQSANACGFTRQAFYSHRRKNPEFKSLWESVAPLRENELIESTFLSALAETGSVKLSSAATGTSPQAFYARRKRNRSFSERWEQALTQYRQRVPAPPAAA